MVTRVLTLVFCVALVAGCSDDAKTSTDGGVVKHDAGASVTDGGRASEAGSDDPLDGAAPTCDKTNCTGCCNGNTCVTTTTAMACGKNGLQCETCGSGRSCTNGACVSPCGPSSCNGCCSANGTCVDGKADTACGTGGAACAPCGSGQACSNNKCLDSTCAGTCAGCCNGATCVSPTTGASCGGAGESCMDCGTGRACSAAGECEVDTTSLWDVFIIDGTVAPLTHSGSSWDPFGGLPDCYVYATVGGTTGQTTEVDNSLSPVWNQNVLTSQSVMDLRNGLTLAVYDADSGSFDDLIGNCINAIDDSDFGGGTITSTCPAGSPNSPDYVVHFQIKPHM